MKSITPTKRSGIDWILVGAIVPLLCAGLATMNSFGGSVSDGRFFVRQLIWILISVIVFFVCSIIDFRFLRKTWVSVTLVCDWSRIPWSRKLV